MFAGGLRAIGRLSSPDATVAPGWRLKGVTTPARRNSVGIDRVPGNLVLVIVRINPSTVVTARALSGAPATLGTGIRRALVGQRFLVLLDGG